VRGPGGGNPWRQRVDSADWEAITTEVNLLGGALLPELLTPADAERIRGLYEQAGLLWLRMCHDAGQGRSTAILLRYGQGDWNALHRDLYGDRAGSSC